LNYPENENIRFYIISVFVPKKFIRLSGTIIAGKIISKKTIVNNKNNSFLFEKSSIAKVIQIKVKNGGAK